MNFEDPARDTIFTDPRDVIERPQEFLSNFPGNNDTFFVLVEEDLNIFEFNAAVNDMHGDENPPHDVELSEEEAETNIRQYQSPLK